MSIVWFMIIITKSCIIPINTNFIFYEQIFAFVLLSQVIIALKFRLWLRIFSFKTSHRDYLSLYGWILLCKGNGRWNGNIWPF